MRAEWTFLLFDYAIITNYGKDGALKTNRFAAAASHDWLIEHMLPETALELALRILDVDPVGLNFIE